ncbi:MAG: hypothetical protein JOY62_16015 [Acidobacteriaceae bacterium]|nr:hypothetical protein [Acidobacteriaceae bacterium]MBV9781469.1 hypothetical protein [Acidobacteriaceae bacterium]
MFTRTMQSLMLGCLVVAAVSAADDPFVGTWKLNTQESKMTGFQEKIQSLGDNKYKFTFGNNSDVIVADGTDQPSNFGGTWSLKQEGPNTWKSVDKQNGKTTSSGTWTMSDDGKEMTIKNEGTREDGSTFNNTFKLKRLAGSSGLAGTWQSTEANISSPVDWKIEKYESDGLSFVFPSNNERLDFKFDGKDYTATGPRVTPGSTSSARRVDDRTIEVTDKLKGKVMSRDEYKVSEDGRKLTITAHYPGVSTPETTVYDRQ